MVRALGAPELGGAGDYRRCRRSQPSVSGNLRDSQGKRGHAPGRPKDSEFQGIVCVLGSEKAHQALGKNYLSCGWGQEADHKAGLMEAVSKEAQGSQPSPTCPTDRVLQPRAIPTAPQCHSPLRVRDSRLPASLCSHCEYACPCPDCWSLTLDWSDLRQQPWPILRINDFWPFLHSPRMLRPSPCQPALRRGRRSVLMTQPVASQASSLVSMPSSPHRPLIHKHAVCGTWISLLGLATHVLYVLFCVTCLSWLACPCLRWRPLHSYSV